MAQVKNIAVSWIHTVFLCAALLVYSMPSNAVMVLGNIDTVTEAAQEKTMRHCDESAAQKKQSPDSDCCEHKACGCIWLSCSFDVINLGDQNYAPIDDSSGPKLQGTVLAGLGSSIPHPPPIS